MIDRETELKYRVNQLSPAILNVWVVSVYGDAYTPPELMGVRLGGKVFNHPSPSFQDGTWCTPTRPVAFDPESKTFKTKSGTTYVLGEPDVEYAKNYPNALDRLVKEMSKLPPL